MVQIGVGFTGMNCLWAKMNCIKMLYFTVHPSSFPLFIMWENCYRENCVMRFSTGSQCHRVLGEWRKQYYFSFFLFSNTGYSLFCNISSEHCCSENSVLFSTEMKCNLGFSASRCAVIYLLTIADSEDLICNTDLKLIHFKGR